MTAGEVPVPAGLHAPYGRLVRDEQSDLVLCHLCGRWFRALGSHVKAHGLSADEYRAAFGLYQTRALASGEVSRARAEIQRARYRDSADTRRNMAAGQVMAGSGRLTLLAADARRTRRPAAQNTDEQRSRLAAGRRTMAESRERQLDETVARLGFADLESCLRGLYQQRQLDLDTVRAELGIGRERLRSLLAAHGIEPRRQGANTRAGRTSRARLNDAEAAARVGAADLHRWLVERRREGWTLARLADAVGHSVPWVSARLRRPD
ncbi:hypothetical protein DPM19_01340 [Actinomadura craniellae]|uniref:MucR family transcriptional regulator n=1 Tax=Actinomadura craniellae TaxID=2231787 RepID=A0A365HCV3_9ACTN|nr:MucR family transcriptional regulator [Actinomadura craniellae]RAY16838.1 hypothetical protein DPM19_01340 [Actinomadura craniellae]